MCIVNMVIQTILILTNFILKRTCLFGLQLTVNTNILKLLI